MPPRCRPRQRPVPRCRAPSPDRDRGRRAAPEICRHSPAAALRRSRAPPRRAPGAHWRNRRGDPTNCPAAAQASKSLLATFRWPIPSPLRGGDGGGGRVATRRRLRICAAVGVAPVARFLASIPVCAPRPARPWPMAGLSRSARLGSSGEESGREALARVGLAGSFFECFAGSRSGRFAMVPIWVKSAAEESERVTPGPSEASNPE